MANVASSIQGSEKLTQIFGHWPSFHDAEVISLHLRRGNNDPRKGPCQFPTLTLDLHHWELTEPLEADGYFVPVHPTRTTLQFRGIERFKMNGFNHQNAIFELSIDRLERVEKPSTYFEVELEAALDAEASFQCREIEVISAHPCELESAL